MALMFASGMLSGMASVPNVGSPATADINKIGPRRAARTGNPSPCDVCHEPRAGQWGGVMAAG
jgi:hypothetical protein